MSVHGLEIDELRNVWMHKDMVTTTDASQLEAEPLGESAQIGKGHIGRGSACKTHEKSRWAIISVAVVAAMMFTGCEEKHRIEMA